jgi:hypothetical protein
MRSFALLAALMGSALAAPYTHIANTKRAVENKPTKITKGPSKVMVTKDNTLNGTFTGDKAMTVSATKTQANERPLNLELINNLGDNVNAYISGADSEGKVFFLSAEAQLIYPSSGGSAEPKKVEEAIAIPMGAVGETFEITVPISFDSGRIYFVQDGELEFFMVATDGGDGLVQPSIHNEGDSARDLNWGWSELTHTAEGVVWSNISYVDFVGLILSMTLTDQDGSVQEVIGLGPDAVGAVCEDLIAQGEADGMPWGASCIEGPNGPLRVLALQDAEGFDDYFTEYVDEVWEKYTNEPLTINTQNGNATTQCQVVDNFLECEGDNRGYPKPEAFDIWGCNTGPFNAQPGTDNPIHLAVVPRLCAAFVRSTLTLDGGNVQPGLPDTEYYTMDPTHHYSRIVHEHEIDGKGYAFPYDDVNPDASEDAAGLITSGNHQTLTFHIGGKANA